MNPPLRVVPPPRPVCPVCIVEYDEDGYCSMCSRMDTASAARAFLLGRQAYAAGVRE